MDNKPTPSPWLKDIRWGEWVFFILGSGLTAFAAALQAGVSIKQAQTAGVITAMITAGTFLRNPKALPWVEVGQVAVTQKQADSLPVDRTGEQNVEIGFERDEKEVTG